MPSRREMMPAAPHPRARRSPREHRCHERTQVLLRDDADLLPERRAAFRARLHVDRLRRAGPLSPARRPAGAISSPAPTSTGSRSSRPRCRPAFRRRNWRTATPRAFASCSPRSTSPTTISSARPSRATTRSCPELWRRMAASGDIYLDSYAGWYSVRQEAYFKERRDDRRPRWRAPRAARLAGRVDRGEDLPLPPVEIPGEAARLLRRAIPTSSCRPSGATRS